MQCLFWANEHRTNHVSNCICNGCGRLNPFSKSKWIKASKVCLWLFNSTLVNAKYLQLSALICWSICLTMNSPHSCISDLISFIVYSIWAQYSIQNEETLQKNKIKITIKTYGNDIGSEATDVGKCRKSRSAASQITIDHAHVYHSTFQIPHTVVNVSIIIKSIIIIDANIIAWLTAFSRSRFISLWTFFWPLIVSLMRKSNPICKQKCKAQNQMFPYLISHLFVFCSFRIQLQVIWLQRKTVKQTFTQIYNFVKLNFQWFHFKPSPPSARPDKFFQYRICMDVCTHSIYSFNTNVYLVSTIEMRFIQDGFPINIHVDIRQFYNFDHVRYLRVQKQRCQMHDALCLMRMFVEVLCSISAIPLTYSLAYSSIRLVQRKCCML